MEISVAAKLDTDKVSTHANYCIQLLLHFMLLLIFIAIVGLFLHLSYFICMIELSFINLIFLFIFILPIILFITPDSISIFIYHLHFYFFFSLFLGLVITVPVVSDMSTNGLSNDDSSGGGSPDAAGSEGLGKYEY